MSSDEAIVSEKRARRKPTDIDDNYQPQLEDDDDEEPIIMPRRSNRSRQKVIQYNAGDSDPDPEETAPVDERLQQFPYQTATQLGVANDPHATVKIRIHPVAMALMSFHAHLSRTEIIGYFGGVVRTVDGMVEVIVAEAFPAQGLNERELAREGRSAFQEVEMDPESSADVTERINAKGLSVVGWYHSHPDKCFTVEPSRVDIENQQNYQEFIARDLPFVAAIIAPYNEDLPDHKPAVEFFRVWNGEVPLRLNYTVEAVSEGLETYRTLEAHANVLSVFVGECLSQVDKYSEFPKRVRLERRWRGEMMGVDKLREELNDLAAKAEDPPKFRESVGCVLDAVDNHWKDSERKEQEKRVQSRENAKKKRKRPRKW